MKLLNWNICMKLDNNAEVEKLINDIDADICALQEVMNGSEDSCYEMYKSKNRLIENEKYPFNGFAPLFIAKRVTENGKVKRDFGGKAEQGSLILSKYNIIEHKNQFYYNEYRYEYDATNFFDNDWCRSIQNAIIDIEGKSLQLINVHGIWNNGKKGDVRTIEQSKFILSKIRDDIPCIVVGDFNLLPDTESIKLIEDKMLNLVNLYGVKTTRPAPEELVCDYIFINDKIKLKDFGVLNSNISDHLPLILDFEI